MTEIVPPFLRRDTHSSASRQVNIPESWRNYLANRCPASTGDHVARGVCRPTRLLAGESGRTFAAPGRRKTHHLPNCFQGGFMRRQARLFLIPLAASLSGCWGDGGSSGNPTDAVTAESCMTCHNGASHDDYAGKGLENPHPFPGAATLRCTECHGGD